jgi:ferric-dicitrate binding protein FerR (iron transport regulator)
MAIRMEKRNIISTQERILSRDPLHAYEKVMRRIKRKKRRLWLARGSTVILSMTAVYLWLWFFPVKTVPPSKQQVITMETKAGMRTSFQLPDCTLVYLNSGSRLSYPAAFDKKERRLELSGEAYFKVKHDPGRPFRVDVLNKELMIKVLGTEFNIEAYCEDEIINTTLVQGSLQITGEMRNGTFPERTLVPSEKATYFRTDGRLDVKVVDMSCDTGWMEGKVVLKNTLLSEMLRKLTHYYNNVDFIVEDPVIETYSFTGTFDEIPLLQVLDYLKISSDIDYQIALSQDNNNENIHRKKVILKKKE